MAPGEGYYAGPMNYSTPNGTTQGTSYGSLDDRRKGENEGRAPARMIVTLPADATLTVDGQATRSTSELRTFLTPPLDRGKTFQYDLRAEINREAKPVVMNKKVEVRAGEDTRVTLSLADARTAQK
jgi:uncharacterized protein (TIGR03000 family)